MKKILIAVFILVILNFLTGQAFAQKAITLSLGHIMAPETHQGVALNSFAKLVKEKTKGKIEVNIYPSQQLGNAMKMMEGVSMGTQDMVAESTTFWEIYADDLKIAETPFTFRDRDHFAKFLKSPIFRKIEQDVIKNGKQRFITTQYTWGRGPYRVLISKNKPINTPDDLKGFKLRLWEARTIHRYWQWLGATTVTISFGEAYLAMKQGIVDGVTSPFDAVWGMKFTEVAQYVNNLDEYWQTMVISMNEQKFQSLGVENQKALIDAANEAGVWYTKRAGDAVNSDIQRMKTEHGAVFNTPDRKPWVEKIKGLAEKLEEEGYWRKGLNAEVQALK
ncbi:MAG: TRAP transporter substrate-binding protein [Syntrophales bacterium]|nr:TRAP transporter substrate-binding protein [Syntrophales bacterium]